MNINKIKQIVFILVALLITSSTQAEIYKWVDEAGRVHYSDVKPEEAKVEKLNIKPVNSITVPEVVDIGYEPPEREKRRGKKVVMYSTEWCGYCKKAAAYFRKNNIPFKEYDVEKTEKGKKDYKKLNGSGVPIILVGDKRMNGFSEARFDALYK